MNELIELIFQHTVSSAKFFIDAFFFGFLPIAVAAVFTLFFLRVIKVQAETDQSKVVRLTANERLLASAFAGLGIMVGMWTGTSRTAVVGSILPALLTLISGYLVHLFTSENRIINRRILPYCLVALIVSASFGAFYGASVRIQAEQNDREWEKHLIEFREIQVPLEKERLKRELEKHSTKKHSNS